MLLGTGPICCYVGDSFGFETERRGGRRETLQRPPDIRDTLPQNGCKVADTYVSDVFSDFFCRFIAE